MAVCSRIIWRVLGLASVLRSALVRRIRLETPRLQIEEESPRHRAMRLWSRRDQLAMYADVIRAVHRRSWCLGEHRVRLDQAG